ncbi:MAG: YraN family protein [Bacteroidales bacterium]|jgi:putative endonuclease|nr:YraN family protein [Bacteroidales bacterium]MCI1784801.1 YraN family protein [Bacteroidales bacterium]
MGKGGKSSEREEVGKRGEDIACRYLMSKGHTILERNWRSRHLEIDIISFDRDGIHFVEVKSRKVPMEAEPEKSVTLTKQKRIAAAAAAYLHSDGISNIANDAEVLFDIIAVTFDGDKTEIAYFRQAYTPIYV